MSRKIKYSVVEEDNTAELERSVALMAEEGFQPFGSLVVIEAEGENGKYFHYFQAMVLME